MLYANTEVQISKMTMLLNILLLRRVKVLSILKKSNNTHQLASRRKFIILTKKRQKQRQQRQSHLLPIPLCQRKSSFYICEQNVWNKGKKSRRIGREHKTLTSTFASFLTGITNILFLKERLNSKSYADPILTFS